MITSATVIRVDVLHWDPAGVYSVIKLSRGYLYSAGYYEHHRFSNTPIRLSFLGF